jgi:hypothetical protein
VRRYAATARAIAVSLSRSALGRTEIGAAALRATTDRLAAPPDFERVTMTGMAPVVGLYTDEAVARLQMQLRTAIAALGFYRDAEPHVVKRDDGNRARLALAQIEEKRRQRDRRKRPRSLVPETDVEPLERGIEVATRALKFYASTAPPIRRQDAGNTAREALSELDRS